MLKSAVLLLLLSAVAAAQATGAPIGFVKTVSGQAQVITGPQVQTAVVGTPVHLGSVLRTGARSSLGVTLRDETVMSFGPNTELTVDEFVYAPAQREGRLSTRLARGTLNYVSGAIARHQPENVQVRTPTGTIGIRGTHFVVEVDEVTGQISAR
ncbi:FecR family protein [Serpentinimonas barnesii]|uniref:FecR family protein n=1 Tax=Serpentinimonas barnesii TaxID=1458427 RepID=UPI0005ED8563|nr:FecR domain-containing protein [Serpentinimonas barnesii]